jgi:hypothetical protein
MWSKVRSGNGWPTRLKKDAFSNTGKYTEAYGCHPGISQLQVSLLLAQKSGYG